MLQLHWGRRLSHDRSHANPSKKDGRMWALHPSRSPTPALYPENNNSQVAHPSLDHQAPVGRGGGEEPFPFAGTGRQVLPKTPR